MVATAQAPSPRSASALAIELADVTKTYAGKVQALRGVEMHVRRGEIFGLLGPNGAGKSTLVKIMTTIVRATTARGMILGEPVGHRLHLDFDLMVLIDRRRQRPQRIGSRRRVGGPAHESSPGNAR